MLGLRKDNMEDHPKKNIEIVPELRRYILEAGYELGFGGMWSRCRSRESNESYEEWFCVEAADAQDVIDTFLIGDDALHYDGEEDWGHIIRNGDPRLTIRIKDRSKSSRDITSIFVYYTPEHL